MTVKAHREDGRWFIDDDNGFSKAENELVAGIPEIIQSLCDADKVLITYADKPFKDAVVLELLRSDEMGSTYAYLDMVGWLCPVFFWYFSSPPQKLYVSIRSQE